MNYKLRLSAFFAAVAMLLVLAPLAAQVESNTSLATAGTYKTDIDNLFSVTGIFDVALDKWAGYTKFDDNYAYLGYARKLGDITLGASYGGDILVTTNSAGATDTITIDTSPVIVNDVQVGEIVTTTTESGNRSVYSSNAFGLIGGLGNMGFALNYSQYGTTRDGRIDPTNVNDVTVADTETTNSDTGDATSTTYTDGKYSTMYYVPTLSFGMKLPVGSMVLKPKASLRVSVYDGSAVSTRTIARSSSGSTLGLAQETRTGGFAVGNITPSVTLGTNVDFAQKENLETSAGLDYEFSMPLYMNGYTDVDGSETSFGGYVNSWYENVSRTATTTGTTITTTRYSSTTERTAMSHTITPNYSAKLAVSDKLSVTSKVSARTYISTYTKTDLTTTKTVTNYDSNSGNLASNYTQTVTVTTPGSTDEYFGVTIYPVIDMGLVYQIIPSKFSWNAGFTVNVPTFSHTSTITTISKPETTKTYTTDGNGTVTADEVAYTAGTMDRTETSTVKDTWGNLNTELTTGFTWNIAPNAAFDLLWDMSTDAMPSIMGANSLLESEFSILFSLKY